MQDASTYLKCPPLLTTGNVIINPLPAQSSGFDWFHVKFEEGQSITKILGLADIQPIEDLSGVMWVPVADSHLLRRDPPVYRLVMPGELYFSSEADAVHTVTWAERHHDEIRKTSSKFGFPGAWTKINLHGVLHLMGLWNEHPF